MPSYDGKHSSKHSSAFFFLSLGNFTSWISLIALKPGKKTLFSQNVDKIKGNLLLLLIVHVMFRLIVVLTPCQKQTNPQNSFVFTNVTDVG